MDDALSKRQAHDKAKMYIGHARRTKRLGHISLSDANPECFFGDTRRSDLDEHVSTRNIVRFGGERLNAGIALRIRGVSYCHAKNSHAYQPAAEMS